MMAVAADHRGCSFNREKVIAAFDKRGWSVMVNTGKEFDGNSERNYAGWIVGQWLVTFNTNLVLRFIGEWRKKFSPKKK